MTLKDTRSAPDTEVDRLYRAAATAGPSDAIDRRIRQAARAEIALAGAGRTLARPSWRRWVPAVSAIAVTVLGFSVTMRVLNEQQRHDKDAAASAERPVASGAVPARPPELKQETKSAGRPPADEPKATPREPAVARKPAAAPTAPSQAAAAPAARHEGSNAPPAQRDMRRASEASPFPAASAPAVPAPAPTVEPRTAPVSDELASAQLTAPAPAAGMQGTRPSARAASGPTADSHTVSAKARAGFGAGSLAAKPDSDDRDPEVWLKEVRDLIAAGKTDEAIKSLNRFRERHPSHVLPEDLARLK
jgi:hypothetical protein